MHFRNVSLAFAVVALSACSKSDRTGRELTDLENAAVDTCDRWLINGLKGRVGSIDLDEGVVLTDEDSIDIASNAKTSVGDGAILCSTDPTGRDVIAVNIDGIDVQP